MKSKSFILYLCALVSIALAPTTYAGWSLDNAQSRLSFISIKATDIGEVHTFTHLDGDITDAGLVTVRINLASVETLIPIRNERMLELLFETNLFPSASITASLDNDSIETLAPGSVAALEISAELTIKGQVVPLTMKIFAAKLSQDKVMVMSEQPILITAASLGLSEGVEKLREIAGLPNISQAVPVSFVLSFTRD
jgi:hypothetical protein